MTGDADDNDALPFKGAAANFERRAEGGVSKNQLYLALAVTAIGVAWVCALLFFDPSASKPADETAAPIVSKPGTEQQKPKGETEAEPTPEQLAWRDQALQAIEEVTPRLQMLEKRAVIQWAPDEYEALLAVVAEGEQAYSDQRFRDARNHYTEALSQISALEAQLPAALAAYWGEGVGLLAQKKYTEALEALEIAGLIAPEEESVAAAINTAQQGPAVDRLLIKADFALQRGNAQEAVDLLREAAALDPARADIKQLASRAASSARDQSFSARMKEGHAALQAKRYAKAITAFRAAAAIDPRNQEAASALQEAQKQELSDKLDNLKTQAASAMQAEAWPAARKLYSEALTLQNGIAFAEAGLKKATTYQEKQSQLDDLLARPERLADQNVANFARGLVADLGAETSLPPKLGATREKVKELIQGYDRLVVVTVHSDGQSEISIIRGEQFRPFRQKVLQLRPGKYTMLARRSGYRDKRVSFEVPLNGQPVTITVGADDKL